MSPNVLTPRSGFRCSLSSARRMGASGCVWISENPIRQLSSMGILYCTFEELLQMFYEATYSFKLDLASAYHQLLLEESSRDLMTFITHDGLFRFKRVCFGLVSAPAVFQKMSQVLKNCKNGVCYLDDILVW